MAAGAVSLRARQAFAPNPLAVALVAAAGRQGAVVATAESCTGGLIAGAITDVAGSSVMFDRGFVTYSNAAKVAMLGVAEAALAAHGAVSAEVARQMAAGALQRSGATLAVAVTGIAGPGGAEHKPEGRVWFGLAAQGQRVVVEVVEFGAIGRARVRAATVDHALRLLLAALAEDGAGGSGGSGLAGPASAGGLPDGG